MDVARLLVQSTGKQEARIIEHDFTTGSSCYKPIMKTLMALILGTVLGAALFHVYYLRQPAAAKCLWDHPLDEQARLRCEHDLAIDGYARDARKQLNDLIAKVAN
jgi:hypothetical protein